MKRKRKTYKRSTGKIKNATPYDYNGIHFKSKLEVFMYKQLEKLGVRFEYEGTTYTIMEGFVYQKEKVRPIKYTPDFVLLDYPIIIETKGYANEAFPLRFKLFKKHLVDQEKVSDLYVPKNQKECLKVIEDIKTNHNL